MYIYIQFIRDNQGPILGTKGIGRKGPYLSRTETAHPQNFHIKSVYLMTPGGMASPPR